MTVPSHIEKTKVVFLHIPKTAGTSVHEKMQKNFSKEKICPERFRGLHKFTPQELDNFEFFSGHFTISIVDRIPGRKFIFTVLRNPKDRIQSLYYFWRRHTRFIIEKANLPGPRVAKNAKNFLEFLSIDENVPRNAIKNEMARVLAGNIFTDSENRYFEIRERRKTYISEYEIIGRALATVRRLDYIAFVDSIDEDMIYIARMLGLGGFADLPRSNARGELRPNLEIIEEELIDERHDNLLTYHTQLDQLVYEIARLRRSDIIKDMLL